MQRTYLKNFIKLICEITKELKSILEEKPTCFFYQLIYLVAFFSFLYEQDKELVRKYTGKTKVCLEYEDALYRRILIF